MASLEYCLEGSLEGTSGGISYIFLLCFTVLLKQLRRLYISGFIFQVPPVSDYSTCCTNRVLTRLVHQVYIYAFSAPTTYLRIQCTPEVLTNQGGRTHQYIDYIACFNIRDSHHPNKHTILHVFHARGYDSIVPLSWYKQFYYAEVFS